jgi:penicillin-binding protein 2
MTQDPFAGREQLAREQEPPRARRRSAAMRLMLLFAFGVMTLQLWRLQIVEWTVHRTAAEGNRIRVVSIPALRGVIYDRHGEILAANAPAFAVSVVEADLPKPTRGIVIGRLAELLGTSTDELERAIVVNRVEGDVFRPIPVQTNVAREVALTIEEHSWELPGVQVSVESEREYMDSLLLAHVLGYLAPPSQEEYDRRFRPEGYEPREKVGVSGIEATYETELRGRHGTRLVEVDAAGRPLRELRVLPPEPGRNLRLTLDLSLQRAVGEILQGALPKESPGVAIVSDPRNGEILAMVSTPGFDANVFSHPERDSGIAALLADKNLPLFHRAIAGQYPPGSTFKLVTAAGALQENIANRSTQVRCEGNLRVPNPYNPLATTVLKDWAVHGVEDFVQGLANSCDVYYYILGGGHGDRQGLGLDRLGQYARLMGYGAVTGIDLPGEEIGQVPTEPWKVVNFGERWLTGDTYNLSIGQGFMLATPLQVANVTNALANGGSVVQPHLGRMVTDSEGHVLRTIEPAPVRSLGLRPDVLAIIKDGMEAVLATDQAREFRLSDVRTAGKTGTAEFPGPLDDRGNLPTHGWYTTYGPLDRPEVSVTVFVEHGAGPSNAVPISQQIMRWYFDHRAEIQRP